MAKGGGGSPGKYTVPTTRGDVPIDGTTLDPALQERGLIINGGAGNDTIRGGSGADLLSGGDGTDYIYGDISDLEAANGATVWDGGKGTDTLDLSLLPYDEGLGTYLSLGLGGPSSTSRIWTNVYNPDGSIWGFDTADAKYLNPAKGFENVVMGGGDDWVDIGNGLGNNTLYGGGGNDVLNAGDGNDTIFGGDGNDMVNGSWGNDVLTRGTQGTHMFLFIGRLAGQYTFDTITDFDIDASDGVTDSLWMGANYSVLWDQGSPTLHGYVFDNGTAVGEIFLQNLTYADAETVKIYYGVDSTGFPIG